MAGPVSAGEMRVKLQALLDDKEKQLNLAGTLGQRILGQQLELEERINQLVDVEERLQNAPGDVDTEMRIKLQELADVMQAWETENERMFEGFGTKVCRFLFCLAFFPFCSRSVAAWEWRRCYATIARHATHERVRNAH